MANAGDRAETEFDLRRKAGIALGQVLRERGESESATARAIGVHSTSLHRWIHDPDKPPTLPRIQQLADHLRSPALRRLAEQIFALGGQPKGEGLTAAQADHLREISAKIQDLVDEIRGVLGADS